MMSSGISSTTGPPLPLRRSPLARCTKPEEKRSRVVPSETGVCAKQRSPAGTHVVHPQDLNGLVPGRRPTCSGASDNGQEKRGQGEHRDRHRYEFSSLYIRRGQGRARVSPPPTARHRSGLLRPGKAEAHEWSFLCVLGMNRFGRAQSASFFKRPSGRVGCHG